MKTTFASELLIQRVGNIGRYRSSLDQLSLRQIADQINLLSAGESSLLSTARMMAMKPQASVSPGNADGEP